MEEFFFVHFGISPELLNYLILPLLIFLARIGDVSISTIRIIFVMNANRVIAPLLGFFEALIWLLAIGQIFNNIDNFMSYVAYAAGFATGTYVGITLEARLAYGNVVVRLFVPKPIERLREFLEEQDYRYSIFEASGRTGKVNLVFLVVKREKLETLIAGIEQVHPKAFYTIEGVKQVSEERYLKNYRKSRRKRKRKLMTRRFMWRRLQGNRR